MPFEENKCNILENTSRLNNEILKQRLSCIPIHIKDLTMPLSNYQLEVNEINLTDTMMYVTTEHFKIKNINTQQYLEEKDVLNIFPSYVPPTGKGEYFIDFVRLRPKISEEIVGEKINLTCLFSIGTAKEDSMFNVVGTCSYGFTPDPELMRLELQKKQQIWRDENKTAEEIDFESNNWKLLDGLRFVKKNSYDFVLETLGVFENEEIVKKACEIIISKMQLLKDAVEKDELSIKHSNTTMDNCFDITLENEDYTIGNILNLILFNVGYRDTKVLTYCGFKKMHPHDSDSIIRIAFKSPTASESDVKQMMKYTVDKAIGVLDKIHKLFGSSKK
jgi:DNA-directed RNA polymerase subunit L